MRSFGWPFPKLSDPIQMEEATWPMDKSACALGYHAGWLAGHIEGRQRDADDLTGWTRKHLNDGWTARLFTVILRWGWAGKKVTTAWKSDYSKPPVSLSDAFSRCDGWTPSDPRKKPHSGHSVNVPAINQGSKSRLDSKNSTFANRFFLSLPLELFWHPSDEFATSGAKKPDTWPSSNTYLLFPVYFFFSLSASGPSL